LLGALLVVLAGRSLIETVAFQQVFRDNESLWSYETTRDGAAVVAHLALAREYRRQAEAAPPGPARSAAIVRARETVTRALAHSRSIPWRDAPGYRVEEIAHLSQLLTIRGQLAALAGAPLATQLRLYREANAVASTTASLLMLARTLERAAAGEAKPELAREALDAYRGYVDLIARDAAQHATAVAILEDFARRFPELAAEARALAARVSR
jgi:hypothetical protein